MLYIHTSNHLEQLKKQYAELIKTPLKDVFKTETVIVQNAGMARWLSIEMAKTTGISANTEYLFPAEYMWRLLRLVSPDIPEHSQCAPDTLRFHIYNELITSPDDYPELKHYITSNDEVDELSSWELSCQIARLLDQYLFYREDWIQDWESNKSSENINHWQARLWNQCVKEKGLLHWLLLQKQFSENIKEIDTHHLEERVSFFSMSALSPGYIDLLARVAEKTDIHIFIINPCADVYWGDIQSPKTYAKLEQTEQEYSDIGNPLLASLGKQGRDFIDKLITIQDQGLTEEYIESEAYASTQKQSLLNQIQQDIYALQEPSLIKNNIEGDDTIQFHACHTAMREVEVLHDQILSQLDADKDLAPSDIVVMMPDIEKYAPYIESVFSNSISDTSAQKLPFSIADRDPQNIFKIIQALNKLLSLPDSRFDVESVLELLEYDDIRAHFDLDEDQYNYCRELAIATNIRWGISAKSRQQNQLPNTEEHTWKYALDRILLGYSIFENESNHNDILFESNRALHLLPYTEVEGSNALVLAKFKKFIDNVFTINDWHNKSYSLNIWIDKTVSLMKQLFPENSDQERLFKTLADIEIKADLAEFTQTIRFNVFQKILQQSLSEISASEKFLGYGITFCALVPMRSVPFKIVALMGMNDGEFPRQDTRPSFDLMANHTRRGDRSRRDEDRYLFLESLLAARQKLIISYIGQSIKDNSELAPSILVSELLDTVNVNTGIEAKDWIIKHPLQAFSSRYFENRNGKNQHLFSYAAQYIQSQSSIKDECTTTDSPFISKPLTSLSEDYKNLSLNQLIDFYKNPSRAFLKLRFGIDHTYEEKELNIREPFEVESFKERDIRNLILSETIDDDDKALIARAKGLIPYGEIGDAIYNKERITVQTFEQQLPEIENLPDISFTLQLKEFELQATINNLSDIGRCVKQVSTPFASDYIDLWVTHLCLNHHFNQSSDSRLIPLTQFYSPEKSFQLNHVEDTEQQLSFLLENYWQGLHYPLAFFTKSSFALFAKTGNPNLTDLNRKWNGDDFVKGEKESFEHWLLHRHIIINTEQQEETFMQLSEQIFGRMFSVITEL